MCGRPAASVETAKEVKIFGLNAFLIDRYRALAGGFLAANRELAVRRATWGGVFTAIGTCGYYLAYAYIAWRTLERRIHDRRSHVSRGLVPAPAHASRRGC